VAVLVATVAWTGCARQDGATGERRSSPKPRAGLDALIDTACGRMAAQLLARDKLAGRTVAVMPLADSDGGVRRLGVLAAEGIERALLATGIKTVDRQQLNHLLNEIDLQRAMALDDAMLKKADDLTRADTLVVGRVVSAGTDVLLSVKAVRVGTSDTGNVIAATGNQALPADRMGELMWYVRRPHEGARSDGDARLPALALAYELVSPTPAGEMIVRNGDTVRSNQKFKIRVQPNSDCFLYVLLYDSAGAAGVLFPHRDIKMSNLARGGVTCEIPERDNWYWFDEQPGTETFYIVASYTPLDNLQTVLAAMQRAGDERRKQAAAARREIDTVITRGMTPQGAADYSPEGFRITTRGVGGITKLTWTALGAAASSPAISTGHATAVQRIVLRHR